MKNCTKCTTENPDSARFCAGCGGNLQSPLEVFLQQHDLLKLLKPIQDNDFTTPEELLTLTDADLGELGLSLGDKIRLKKALDTLRSNIEEPEENIDEDKDIDAGTNENAGEGDESDLECIGFTLTTETDLTVFDPSVSTIRDLINNDDERGDFMILTDSSDDEIYMQTRFAKSDDEGDWFDLEFRDGSSERHYESSEYINRNMAASILISYGTGNPSWRKELTWKKINLDGDDEIEDDETQIISSEAEIMDILNSIPANDRIYIAPNIPSDKFNAAYKSYVRKAGVEAYLMYDVTLFRGAKDGLIIAKDGLYIKDSFESPTYYLYSDILTIERKKLHIYVNGVDKMNCIEISGVILDKIIKIISILASV